MLDRFTRINKRTIILLVVFILLLGFLDAKNVDGYLYKVLKLGHLSYYDLPIWEFLVALGTLSAVIVALFASYRSIDIEKKQSKQIEKQLRIEQEPYVVAVRGISIDGYGSYGHKDNKNYLRLHIKNIGRGPAVRITVTGSEVDAEAPLMEDKHEPHSVDLGSGDEISDWKIDEGNLKQLVKSKYNADTIALTNDQPIYLYIFFNDQLKKRHRTEVKLQKSGSGDFLKVMENKHQAP